MHLATCKTSKRFNLVNNLVDKMEFKYTESTMCLTCVVNGDCLVEPLDWLAL